MRRGRGRCARWESVLAVGSRETQVANGRAVERGGLPRVERPPDAQPDASSGGASRQRPLIALIDHLAPWAALLVCSALVAAVYGQALGFAFTFDDPLDLPRAEGRSVWSLLSTSEGYAYYRPIPFILWKGLRALQGHYDKASLHGLTLLAHTLGAWLLYLLLRRLAGGHWGILASVLFVVYPFSYQAVFGAHTLFHPLMTAAILASLVLYFDARARQDRLRPVRLAGSVLAACVALWTHESGVVILPLVAGLELVLLARAGGWRPSWWPLLHGAATAFFLVVWLTVPKWPRQDPWTAASLAPNARYFLQGVIYPVAAQLKAAGERWGFDPARAVWPAIVATLLGLLVVYTVGRRPWVPVVALAAAAIVLVPAWALLTTWALDLRRATRSAWCSWPRPLAQRSL